MTAGDVRALGCAGGRLFCRVVMRWIPAVVFLVLNIPTPALAVTITLCVLSGARAEDKPGLVLPAGHRAFTLKVPTDNVADGFILPGHRVAILLFPCKKDREPQVLVVLQDVLVVAVDKPARKGEEKVPEPTITVAVMPEEARRLAEAAEMGTFRVALGLNSMDEKQRK
jgi:Flp pilus assembly protein CpaB